MFEFSPGFFVYLAVMAAVTYIVRALPLLLVRGKIKNRFIRSFLHYVPYSVLSAMAFPAIFFSTGSVISAVVGCAVATVLALLGKNLITASAGCSLSVLICELVMMLIP